MKYKYLNTRQSDLAVEAKPVPAGKKALVLAISKAVPEIRSGRIDLLMNGYLSVPETRSGRSGPFLKARNEPDSSQAHKITSQIMRDYSQERVQERVFPKACKLLKQQSNMDIGRSGPIPGFSFLPDLIPIWWDFMRSCLKSIPGFERPLYRDKSVPKKSPYYVGGWVSMDTPLNPYDLRGQPEGLEA